MDRLAANLPIAGLALEVALRCRYCLGMDEAGNAIVIVDERAEMLREAADRSRLQPAEFLDLECVFADLGGNSVFRQEFTSAMTRLYADGVRQALADYLDR